MICFFFAVFGGIPWGLVIIANRGALAPPGEAFVFDTKLK